VTESRTAGGWRAWAEARRLRADAAVDRIVGEANAAADLADKFWCPYCHVLITVPLTGGRYNWQGAWPDHELTCSAGRA